MPSTPLLLLPGLMNDASVWDDVRFAMGKDRHVVNGRTETHAAIRSMVIAAIDAMPVGRFAVAGFSLGGYVALDIARVAPERIAGIGLISTMARADSEEGKKARHQSIDALQSLSVDFARVAAGFLPRLLHPSHAHDPALLVKLSTMASNVGQVAFVRQQRAAMSREDARDVLATLTCPAWIACGEDDGVTPLPCSREMAELLGGPVTFTEISHCGHMSLLEAPETLGRAMGEWLERVDAGGSERRAM